MNLEKVKSSNIAAIGYDPGGKKLRVQFKTGKTYEYEDVSLGRWDDFRNSESKGKHFQQFIRGFHPTRLLKDEEVQNG